MSSPTIDSPFEPNRRGQMHPAGGDQPAESPTPDPKGGDLERSSLRHDFGRDQQVYRYASAFSDLMEMRAPAGVVASYLDVHQGWFQSCASPMGVVPLGERGYILSLGRFGNFGFEVEPRIGLELLPRDNGVYAIITVPIPTNDPALAGVYDVDFNASLELDEAGPDLSHELSNEDVDRLMAHTLVRWKLDLAVWIRLPSMLTLLPDGLLQNSGDHLLRQIVRQISRRLTWKVQEDFHARHGIPCPPRRRAQF
ncbi:MAG: DUF1997 domain-containing protein [Cyanobacteriota bacterium]|nr:DUF1997 domain-containing protein [Cyanobacteriota bacterium]